MCTHDNHEKDLQICECCGSEIESDDHIVICDHHFCDYDCAQDYGYRICDKCGDWFYESDGIFTENGSSFCSRTCAERAGYFQCECCGEWHETDEQYFIADRCEYYCQHCYDWNDCFYCEGCCEYYSSNEYNTDDYYCYCNDCYEDEYSHCELHDYSYRESPVFYGDTKNNAFPFLGVELETDSGKNRHEYVEELSELNYYERFWLTEDGSLENGVEIATHPMTLQQHFETSFWNDIVETAKRNHFVSHDSGNCGMHIHVNRDFFGDDEVTQNICGFKMMRIMQRFETEQTIVSRRNNTSWCSFSTYNDYSPESDYVKDDCIEAKSARMVNSEKSHSQVVNFQHRATFEVRLFRGTLKLHSLYASLIWVNEIARFCKSHSDIFIENCSWDSMVDWILEDLEENVGACYMEIMKEYLESKNILHTGEVIKSSEDEIIENAYLISPNEYGDIYREYRDGYISHDEYIMLSMRIIENHPFQIVITEIIDDRQPQCA